MLGGTLINLLIGMGAMGVGSRMRDQWPPHCFLSILLQKGQRCDQKGHNQRGHRQPFCLYERGSRKLCWRQGWCLTPTTLHWRDRSRVSVTDSKLTRATVCVEVYVKTNKRGKRRKGGKGGLCQALDPRESSWVSSAWPDGHILR